MVTPIIVRGLLRCQCTGNACVASLRAFFLARNLCLYNQDKERGRFLGGDHSIFFQFRLYCAPTLKVSGTYITITSRSIWSAFRSQPNATRRAGGDRQKLSILKLWVTSRTPKIWHITFWWDGVSFLSFSKIIPTRKDNTPLPGRGLSIVEFSGITFPTLVSTRAY